ncbi:Non-structural maintenance of chromosomes element 4-like A, partial [Mucuna pruriens]
MRGSRRGNDNGDGDAEENVKKKGVSEQNPATRRVIRSQFLKLKTLINEKRDDLIDTESDKFDTILDEFDKLHDQVEKPREQVADAEALLDLTRTLVGSVRSLTNEGVTPSQFVSSLLIHYGQGQDSINWQKLGLAVSPIFLSVHGSSTMLGPMDNEFKQRKTGVRRNRATRPTATTRPQQVTSLSFFLMHSCKTMLDNVATCFLVLEDKRALYVHNLDEVVTEEKTDTDKNMATMFDILRRTKRVRLENLILNRTSFAQTVENLFALSFLVKDGRAEISLDGNRSHYVCKMCFHLNQLNTCFLFLCCTMGTYSVFGFSAPKNAPAANLVSSKEVSYTHFVFRYDYQDWKCYSIIVVQRGKTNNNVLSFFYPDSLNLTKDLVPEGKELMPARCCTAVGSQEEMGGENSQPALAVTPIRKLSRNRGLVVQEESVVEETPDCDEEKASRIGAIRRCR